MTWIQEAKKLGHDPRRMVKWARENPKSELHSQFEWDDAKAGYRYRLQQARQLILRIQVEVVDNDGAPKVAHMMSAPYVPRKYMRPDEVRADISLQSQLEHVDHIIARVENIILLDRGAELLSDLLKVAKKTRMRIFNAMEELSDKAAE
jgi:hypothetical protein